MASELALSPRRREPVLGVPVDVLRWNDAVERIFEWAARRESRTVCTCNVHSLVTARRLATHADAILSADLVTPDGAPIAWLLRTKGHRGQQRISGPDLMWICCRKGAEQGTEMFLCGATPGVLRQLKRRLYREFPGIRIVGTFSPPFREPSAAEDAAVVNRINRSGARIVWVGLGCPKQEGWLLTHRGRIQAVMVGVGAAFDFHAGAVKRAPVWVRQIGFEWLHRLCQEPRRLATRYLVTNTIFIVAALQEFAIRRRSGPRLPRPARRRESSRKLAYSLDPQMTSERAAAPLLVTTSWDDGHPSDLRVAELLERHGLQGTFYVPSQNAEGRPVMSPGEVARLAQRFEIGGHTHSHISLTGVAPHLAAEQIIANKCWLEDLLGMRVRGFAYVRGHYDRVVRDLVVRAGYDYARTVKNMMSVPGSNRFELATTAQFFAHSRSTYIKNYISGVPTLRRSAVLAALLSNAGLADRLSRAAEVCAGTGGYFHLWGHSWEVDQYDLWTELDRLLGILHQLDARFVTNDIWCEKLPTGAVPRPLAADDTTTDPLNRPLASASRFSGRAPWL